VFQNLIDNALKFTPKSGSISIDLKNLGGFVEVSIADTGVGIPEDELPYIFDRYLKIKKEGTDNSGIGLGLAIVKKIRALHNTPIRAKSKLHGGTVFYFALPVYKG
jgi:signal transduction histidine kinase